MDAEMMAGYFVAIGIVAPVILFVSAGSNRLGIFSIR
jgi:hypothetical protein